MFTAGYLPVYVVVSLYDIISFACVPIVNSRVWRGWMWKKKGQAREKNKKEWIGSVPLGVGNDTSFNSWLLIMPRQPNTVLGWDGWGPLILHKFYTSSIILSVQHLKQGCALVNWNLTRMKSKSRFHWIWATLTKQWHKTWSMWSENRVHKQGTGILKDLGERSCQPRHLNKAS